VIGWVMILVSGLLASAHCVGMCGGFAVTLATAGAPSWTANLGRQALYSLGRICTYTLLGAMAGFGGAWITRTVPFLTEMQGIFAVAAGFALVVVGLGAAGVLGRAVGPSNSLTCRAAGLFAGLLRSPSGLHVFIAGTLNGVLPCGLVYAFLALAASSGHMHVGALTMAIFGLGTAPAMLLTGAGTGILAATLRRRLFQIAAWCVVLTGLLTVVRGAGFAELPRLLGLPGNGPCPVCSTTADA
jgi:sulfite exporter TauE/SafE